MPKRPRDEDFDEDFDEDEEYDSDDDSEYDSDEEEDEEEDGEEDEEEEDDEDEEEEPQRKPAGRSKYSTGRSFDTDRKQRPQQKRERRNRQEEEYEEEEDYEEEDDSGGRRNKKILLGAVVGAAVVACVCMYFYGKPATEEEPEQPTVQITPAEPSPTAEPTPEVTDTPTPTPSPSPVPTATPKPMPSYLPTPVPTEIPDEDDDIFVSETLTLEDPAAEENPEEPATEEEAVIEPAKTLFVGDSRFRTMYDVENTGEEMWECSADGDYSWFANTALPEVDPVVGEGTKVIISVGLNDLGSSQAYADVINTMAAEWTSRGAKVYFVAVGPVASASNILNTDICNFNTYMYSNLTIPFIDLYNYFVTVGFDTEDGTVYTDETCSAMYTFITQNAQ